MPRSYGDTVNKYTNEKLVNVLSCVYIDSRL